MKATLQPSLEATVGIEVDRDRTIGFMGDEARVYATPTLVRDIEVACRELIRPHLDDGEDSVGTRIELDHLAATPLGMRVELTVRVAGVAGRAVTFEVEGRDAVERVCHAKHARFVVDVAKTKARIAAKIQKAAA
jgi:predicted thioesterase